MYLRDLFLGKRGVRFETRPDGIQQECEDPSFTDPFVPSKIPFLPKVPTCTDTVAAAASTAPPAAASTSADPPPPATTSETPPPPVTTSDPPPPPTTLTTSSLVIATTPIPVTLTSIVSITSIATVFPESSIAPTISSVLSSAVSSSTPSVDPIPLPLSTTGSSESAITSSTLGPISSSFVQTSSSVESTAFTSSISMTAIISVASTTSSLLQSTASATASPESTSNDEIVAGPSLSTNTKVAIAAAIILSALALFVGALYMFTRRRRAEEDHMRSGKFSMMSNDYIVDEGEKTSLVMSGAGNGVSQPRFKQKRFTLERELGPNGYPVDVKMEDGTLLSEAETRPASRARSPPMSMNPTFNADRPVSGLGSSSGSRPTVGEMQQTQKTGPPSRPTRPRGQSSSTNGKGKVDVIALPTPATIAVARAISDNGSFQSQELSREERINMLSNARKIDDGTGNPVFNHNNNTVINPTPVLKDADSPNTFGNPRSKTPSPTPRKHSVGNIIKFPSPIRSRNMRSPTPTASIDERMEEGGGGGGGLGGINVKKEVIQLSEASQELNVLTKEYEAERRKKEKKKVVEVKKCMEKDKDVEVGKPVLGKLDEKKLGGSW